MSTYEIEILSSSDLKRKGGRPRKYATDEERQRAKREQDRKRQEKKRNQKRRRVLSTIESKYIIYELIIFYF